MKIKGKLWDVFLWCLSLQDKIFCRSFKSCDWDDNVRVVNPTVEKYEKKTNICHFVRTLLVTTPLLLFFALGVYPLVFYTLYLIILIISAITWEFLITVGFIVLLIAIILLIVFVYTKAFESHTWEITKEYIKAKKQKICPFVYREEE